MNSRTGFGINRKELKEHRVTADRILLCHDSVSFPLDLVGSTGII